MEAEKVTILIADDDEGHLILVQDTLRSSGLDNPMLTFRDGQEVLDFLHGVHPLHRFNPHSSHLLLLDIRMPKLDGVQTLARIKNDGTLKKLPVIMLTTTDDPREVSRCHELGCSHFLTKPVDISQFSRAINGVGLSISLLRPRTNGIESTS
jgi:CheY-like chemotaxis protein